LKIFKYINLSRNNFNKFIKNIEFKTPKSVFVYIYGTPIFALIIYLSIPAFFSYDKKNIENILCKELNFECLIKGNINYSVFPSPRLKLTNLVVKDFTDKKKTLGKIEKAEIRISLYNLYNKKKLNYTNVNIEKAEINFNLNNLKKYNDFIKNKTSSKPINLKKSKIKFFEDQKEIASITNVDFTYKKSEKIQKGILKGRFLNDDIFISLENNKGNEIPSKTFEMKFSDLNLFTKINLYKSKVKNNLINGNILFKNNENRSTAIFEYHENEIVIKKGNLRNFFADGVFDGVIKILPFFTFDLNIDLKRVNFNRLSNNIVNLSEQGKQKLFKFHKKINGNVNFTVEKIHSKYNLINSFESKLEFMNGNVSIDRLLLNLGKLGAADVTGIIKNEKKFTNLSFENNIFLDNLKRFYNKFGIYNKEKIPFNIFVSGNLDLINLNMRFHEISHDKKLEGEDLRYIENEFNDVVLGEGYVSLLNFLNFKEFIKLVATEIN